MVRKKTGEKIFDGFTVTSDLPYFAKLRHSLRNEGRQGLCLDVGTHIVASSKHPVEF